MGPPVVVFPLLLLLMCLLSSAITQSPSPSPFNLTSPYLSSSFCPASHVLPSIQETLVTINKSLSYYYISIPSSSAGFKLKIVQRDNELRNCLFEVFEGNDTICPDTKNYVRSFNGVNVDLVVSTTTTSTKTSYYALRTANCTSTPVAFQVYTTCPTYCTGPGAHCGSIGCFCESNYYDAADGCYITGLCDPAGSYPCNVRFGSGNQTCNLDRRTNTTSLGKCIATSCHEGFFLDTYSGECIRYPPPPPPPGGHSTTPTTTPNTPVVTKPWWRVGTLNTAASIVIWCAEGIAVLLVMGVGVFFVRRRLYNYHSFKNETDSSDSL